MVRLSYRNHTWSFRWLGPFLALTLAACAGFLPQSPDENALRERAQAYWDARVANDRMTAFRYEIESLEGDPRVMQRYLGRGGVEILSAEVVDVRIVAEDRAEVVVAVRYRMPLGGFRQPLGGDQLTIWILRDRQWYHAGVPAE